MRATGCICAIFNEIFAPTFATAVYFSVDLDSLLAYSEDAKVIQTQNKIPFVKIEPGYNTDQVIKHNYSTWVDMFSERQLLSIYYFMEAITDIQDEKLCRLFACLFSGVLGFDNLTEFPSLRSHIVSGSSHPGEAQLSHHVSARRG